jgi:hypothetical protein
MQGSFLDKEGRPAGDEKTEAMVTTTATATATATEIQV